MRQGCSLSPYLFNTVAEIGMRRTLDGYTAGIGLGGRVIADLRYADDIVLLSLLKINYRNWITDRLEALG